MVKKICVKKLVLSHNGSKSVSPEKINGDPLSITINPEDQYFEYSNDPFERFNVWTAHIYKMLKELRHCDMLLRPEVSHIGRLHLHGVLNVSAQAAAEFALSDIPKLIQIGHTDIDTISDQAVWLTYCDKSLKTMHELTKCNIHYSKGVMSINKK